MNYLGRGLNPCLAGLRNYHHALVRVLSGTNSSDNGWTVRDELQRLLFDLDVDVQARMGPTVSARMTAVEARVFYPTLVGVRQALAEISITSAQATWRAPLTAALALLRGAVRQLHEWCPQQGAGTFAGACA